MLLPQFLDLTTQNLPTGGAGFSAATPATAANNTGEFVAMMLAMNETPVQDAQALMPANIVELDADIVAKSLKNLNSHDPYLENDIFFQVGNNEILDLKPAVQAETEILDLKPLVSVQSEISDPKPTLANKLLDVNPIPVANTFDIDPTELAAPKTETGFLDDAAEGSILDIIPATISNLLDLLPAPTKISSNQQFEPVIARLVQGDNPDKYMIANYDNVSSELQLMPENEDGIITNFIAESDAIEVEAKIASMDLNRLPTMNFTDLSSIPNMLPSVLNEITPKPMDFVEYNQEDTLPIDLRPANYRVTDAKLAEDIVSTSGEEILELHDSISQVQDKPTISNFTKEIASYEKLVNFNDNKLSAIVEIDEHNFDPVKMVDQFKVLVNKAVDNKQNIIYVQLEPKQLGKIEIKLDYRSETPTAMFAVEKSDTLELLQKDIISLQTALQYSGIKAENLQLSLGFNQQNSHQQANENFKFSNAIKLDQLEDQMLVKHFVFEEGHLDIRV